MSNTLDVIILDDDPQVSMLLHRMLEKFHTHGQVFSFSDPVEAKYLLLRHNRAVAIFVLDVFLGQLTAFDFLDQIVVHYPMAYQDTVVITGKADQNVVDMCLASGVNHLLEKPIRTYALRFAVQSIVNKYVGFAQKLWEDPAFAQDVQRIINFQPPANGF